MKRYRMIEFNYLIDDDNKRRLISLTDHLSFFQIHRLRTTIDDPFMPSSFKDDINNALDYLKECRYNIIGFVEKDNIICFISDDYGNNDVGLIRYRLKKSD